MSYRIDSISDLPLQIQDQAAKKLAERVLCQPASDKQDGKKRRSKQGNVSTTVNGIHFDSKKEAKRYEELMLMLEAGLIRDLKLQPQFTLQEAYTTPDGVRIRSIIYKADFSYVKGSEKVVEDVKSDFTRKNKTYRMKNKMMAEKLGIIIQEV